MRNLTFRLVLCILLVTRAFASPITYPQVINQAGQQTQQPTKPTSEVKGSTGQATQTQISESSDRPEFVRLADGRIVPYGPGVICSDDCVQSEAFGPDDPSDLRLPKVGGLNPWVFAVPIAVGGVAAWLLFGRGADNRIVLDTSNPPIINPPPPPPPAEVPEPATLMLLGLGLALMAKHGFGKKKSGDE